MRTVAALAAALIATAGMALADPVEGIWKTQPDDGRYAHVQMMKCGSAICGKLIKTFDATGEIRTPALGRNLVFDMVPTGNGSYRGKVWRPSNDKI